MTICPLCYTENEATDWLCKACNAPLHQNQPKDLAAHCLPNGTALHRGRYLIAEVLGRGGFGITYRATDTEKKRPVAVKELFPEGAARNAKTVIPPPFLNRDIYERFIDQFLGEADLISRLQHPAIVVVYQAFEENNSAYMVMEYHPTETLSAWLDKASLEPADAVHCVVQIGEALAQMHDRGFLHRDIKPGNILYYPPSTEGGKARQAVLIDFGTAREFSANHTRQMTTQLTPGYAPLEQYSEQARRGPYTDIYALAGTLYHLLTGERPVAAADRILGTRLESVRQRNASVSEALSQAIMHGLQMDVTRRPQNVRDFTSELQAALLVQPVEEPPPPAAPEEVDEEESPPPDAQVLTPLWVNEPPVAVEPEAAEAAPACPWQGAPTFQCKGLGAAVTGVAFANGGRQLVACSVDGAISWWQPRSGRQGAVVRMEQARHRFVSLDCHPTNDTVVAGTLDGDVFVFQSGDATPVAQLPQGHRVLQLRYSKDGRFWGVLCRDHGVRIYHEQGRKEKVRLGEASDRLACFDFSPDGNLVVTGGLDGQVRLWEAGAGRRLHDFSGGGDPVLTLAFSPDGQRLAGAVGYEVLIWGTFSGQILRILHHEDIVRSLNFSPDGKWLVAGSDDQEVAVWNLADGTSTPLEGHTGKVTSVAWSASGRCAATGCADGVVRIWWPPSEAEGSEAPSPSAAEPARATNALPLRGHRSLVRAVVFTGDNLIVSGGDDHVIRVWTPGDGRQIGVLPGHDGSVTCLAVSSGGLLASGSEDGTVRVWHLASTAELLVLHPNQGGIRCLAVSPRGRYLACGADAEPRVVVWDLKRQSRQQVLAGHDGPVTSLAFSLDGKWLASASEDRAVRVWEAGSGNSAGSLTGHTGAVWTTAFGAGDLLVSGSADRTVRLWDRVQMKEIRRMTSRSAVRSVAVAPSGRWVAGGADEPAITLWDVATGQETARLEASANVTCLAVSPDASCIVYAAGDSVVRVVPVTQPALTRQPT